MKRYLQIEGSDAKGIADVVEALARLFQGKAECRQVLVVKTDSDALVDGLKALFPGKIGEVEIHGEVKRLEAKASGWMKERDEKFKPQEKSREIEGEHKFDPRFCRNCMQSFFPPRAKSVTCSNLCLRQYTARRIQYQKKGLAIDHRYSFHAENGHWWMDDENGFRAHLGNGEYPEGAKILTPEGWLRVVHMQGGEWTFDEIRPAPKGSATSATPSMKGE